MTPIRSRLPATITVAATIRPRMTRLTPSRRGTSSSTPRPHSGTISRAELHSGVMSSPYAAVVPSPNQRTGARDAARTGVNNRYRCAATTASRCRNWYW